MAKALLTLVSSLAIVFYTTDAAAQLRKVRLAVPTLDIITLPIKMAQAKGFYQKEGLDPEIILIAGALGVKALLGHSVEFSTASGSVMAAAVRGVPVKLVLVIASKPTFDLVSEPKIRSFQQLKGKQVGISTRGGTFDHVTRLILEKNGLDPDKDVAILALGRQDDLHLALKAGRISAAIYSPPRNLMLYRDGFHKLAFSGDYLSHYPIGGLGVTDDLIRKNPGDILAFVRGTLNGLAYYRQHRGESIKFITRELKVSDESLAAQMFDWHPTVLAENPRPDSAWIAGAIEFTKKSLDVTTPIPPEQIFDFSFVEKATR
ncbi:MAG TPA: ABC transporter substrate-binding protein [Candidatus Eisenbacteria bacterium]|nr:ABC transporter substrate-binding protein [Candidatus Eisenbacteria bacterium]